MTSLLASDDIAVDLPGAAILLVIGAGATWLGILGWRGVVGRQLPRGPHTSPGATFLFGVSLLAFGIAAFVRDGLGDVGEALSRVLNTFGFTLWVVTIVYALALAAESFPDRLLPPHQRRTRR